MKRPKKANKGLCIVKKPADDIAGVLEVGHNDKFQVVINHNDLAADENGDGFILLSPDLADQLARVLKMHAAHARAAKRHLGSAQLRLV